MTDKRKLATKAVHGNKQFRGTSGPVAPSLVQSATYVFPDSNAVEGYLLRNERKHYLYGRYGNPLQDELEACLALLEGSQSALSLASGMAAITTAVLSAVESGGEILTIPSLYGQTLNFFRKELPSVYNIRVRECAIEQLYDLKSQVSERTRLVYFETPTNPNLKIVDIRRVADQAKALGIKTMVDNTFASPINQRPIELGVDYVVHSATKYLGGHHDILAGVINGPTDYMATCRKRMELYGATIDPFAAFLLLRSLRTLDVRVQRHNQNALALARYFENHPAIESVCYPGLAASPDHAVARGQMNGFGGMISIDVGGGKQNAMQVVDALELGINATSLGGIHTLVSIPVITSHSWLTPEELAAAEVTPSMIRISVGLEDPEDLIADFEQALKVN